MLPNDLKQPNCLSTRIPLLLLATSSLVDPRPLVLRFRAYNFPRKRWIMVCWRKCFFANLIQSTEKKNHASKWEAFSNIISNLLSFLIQKSDLFIAPGPPESVPNDVPVPPMRPQLLAAPLVVPGRSATPNTVAPTKKSCHLDRFG